MRNPLLAKRLRLSCVGFIRPTQPFGNVRELSKTSLNSVLCIMCRRQLTLQLINTPFRVGKLHAPLVQLSPMCCLGEEGAEDEHTHDCATRYKNLVTRLVLGRRSALLLELSHRTIRALVGACQSWYGAVCEQKRDKRLRAPPHSSQTHRAVRRQFSSERYSHEHGTD